MKSWLIVKVLYIFHLDAFGSGTYWTDGKKYRARTREMSKNDGTFFWNLLHFFFFFFVNEMEILRIVNFDWAEFLFYLHDSILCKYSFWKLHLQDAFIKKKDARNIISNQLRSKAARLVALFHIVIGIFFSFLGNIHFSVVISYCLIKNYIVWIANFAIKSHYDLGFWNVFSFFFTSI